MSGDCEDVALELVAVAMGAYIAGLSPRRRIAFMQRMTDGFAKPTGIKEAGRAAARAQAEALWRELLPKLLAA